LATSHVAVDERRARRAAAAGRTDASDARAQTAPAARRSGGSKAASWSR
jgi:hypothetical protein